MPSDSSGGEGWTGLLRSLGAGLGLAVTIWLGTSVAERAASRVLLNFGPNDSEYATGLRDDWERDGRTIFHWTTLATRIRLPLGVRGDGFVLRLRARRHFLEPAHVVVAVDGRVVDSFDLSANSAPDPRRPYTVREIALPRGAGSTPLQIDLQSLSSNPRPLGIAVDWVEIERTPGAGAWATAPATRWRALGLTLGLWLLLLAAGAGRSAALAAGFVLAATVGAGLAHDPLAAERVLRLGLWPILGVAGLSVVLGRSRKAETVLGLGPGATLAGLTTLVALAMLFRAVLLFHPDFFYPDVRIHAVFARELGKLGIGEFLRTFTANQFRYSLGLQYENGHWYAFPYPPAFYVLCWPLLKAGLRPEVAVSTLAAVANSLETLLVFALARRFSPSRASALAAAAAVPLLPIFMVRLSLAYFPALFGHFVDVLLLCFLAWRWKRLGEWRQALLLALLVAMALLCYTQSVLNLGLLMPLYLLVQLVCDRSPEGRRRQGGLLIAGVLGVLLSLAFYGRYVQVFVDMQRGTPMAGEEIVLARVGPAAGEPSADEPPDDPFSGPGFELGRGLRKAGWRFWLFYEALAPAVLGGLLLLVRTTADDDLRRLTLVWAATYVLLNLASGSLPGPNLVRYNKDLEIVAPLCCVALGLSWDWLRTVVGRWASAALAALYVYVGVGRALRALLERVFVDRSASL